MTTTEALDMIDICYGIRKMYMQVWETAEKMFSIGVPALELFDRCKHEYAEKDAFLESLMEDFKQVHSAQPDVSDTNVGDMISRRAALEAMINAKSKGGRMTLVQKSSIGFKVPEELPQMEDFAKHNNLVEWVVSTTTDYVYYTKITFFTIEPKGEAE